MVFQGPFIWISVATWLYLIHKKEAYIERFWRKGILRDSWEPKKNSHSMFLYAGVCLHRNFWYSDIDRVYWQKQYSHFPIQELCKTHPTLHLSCKLVHTTLSWSESLAAGPMLWRGCPGPHEMTMVCACVLSLQNKSPFHSQQKKALRWASTNVFKHLA